MASGQKPIERRRVVLAVVLATTVVAVVWTVAGSPVRRLCDAMESKCRREGTYQNPERCEATLSALAGPRGEADVARARACVSAAADCASAVRCVAAIRPGPAASTSP